MFPHNTKTYLLRSLDACAILSTENCQFGKVLIIFFFLVGPCGIWNLSSPTKIPGPLRWEHGILTTGSLEKSFDTSRL